MLPTGGKPVFDGKNRMVKVNRNEWMDKVHTTFSENKIRIPRPSLEISEFATEMTRTAKTVIENPDTGLKKPRWIKIRPDHYYHSVLYFLLAAMRTSPRMRHETQQKRPQFAVNNWK